MTDDKKGVSPVVGVIIMIAITVILAAVIASFVFWPSETHTPPQTTPSPITHKGPLVGDAAVGRSYWYSPMGGSSDPEIFWEIHLANYGSSTIRCPGGIDTALATDDGMVVTGSKVFLKSGEWIIDSNDVETVDGESYGQLSDLPNPETTSVNLHVVCMDANDNPTYHLWTPLPAWKNLPSWHMIDERLHIDLQEW